MKLIDSRVRAGKDELEFEKSESEHLLSNLTQRQDKDDLNLKNKKMANDLLRSAIEDLKLNIYDKGALVFDIGEQCKDKEQDVRKLDKETADLGINLIRQKGEYKGFQEQITVLSDQLTTTQFELSSAQTKDKDLSAMINREQKRIDDLEIPGIEIELQSEIERLGASRKELEFEIEQLDPLRETYDHEKREFQISRQKHVDKKEDYRQKLLDLEKVQKETEEKKYQTWRVSEAIEKDKANLVSESEVQTKKESEIQDQMLKKTHLVEKVKEKVKIQKQQKTEMLEQQKALNAEIFEFKQVHKELEDVTGKNRELKTKITETDDESAKINTDLHLKQETINEIEQDLRDKDYQLQKVVNRKDNEMKRRIVENHERDIEKEKRIDQDRKFEQQLAQKLADMEDDILKQVELFQNQNKLVSAELEDAVNEEEVLDLNLKGLDESLSQAETQDTLQKDEISQFKEQKAKEKTHYEQELEESKSKLRTKDSELKDLQEKGEDETRELNRIKQALNEANDRVSKIESEEADKEKIRAEKKKKGEEEKSKLLDEKEKVVGEAKQKLNEFRTAQEQEKEKELEVVAEEKGKIKEEKIIIEDLEKQLSKLKTQMDKVVRDLRRDAEIAKEIERMKEEDERLRAEAIEKQKLELERENARRAEEEAEK